MSYHINDAREAGLCHAKTESGCPFGMSDMHYSSAEAARAAYEANSESWATPMQKEDARIEELIDIIAHGSLQAIPALKDTSLRMTRTLSNGDNVNIRFKPEDYTKVSSSTWENLAIDAESWLHKEDENPRASVADSTKEFIRMARIGQWLSKERKVDGVTIPKGYAVVQAVYDLDGNLLDADRSSSGPWAKLHPLSSIKDPIRRRAENEKHNLRTGLAAYPIELKGYSGLAPVRNSKGIPLSSDVEAMPKDTTSTDSGIREPVPLYVLMSKKWPLQLAHDWE